MPQDLVSVYEEDTGKLYLMHSVDAAEAVRLGGYTYMAPGGKEPSAAERALALGRARGMEGPVLAEMEAAVAKEVGMPTRSAAMVPEEPAHAESRDRHAAGRQAVHQSSTAEKK